MIGRCSGASETVICLRHNATNIDAVGASKAWSMEARLPGPAVTPVVSLRRPRAWVDNDRRNDKMCRRLSMASCEPKHGNIKMSSVSCGLGPVEVACVARVCLVLPDW